MRVPLVVVSFLLVALGAGCFGSDPVSPGLAENHGRLEGLVRTSDGVALPGALVHLVGLAGNGSNTETDRDGRFSFDVWHGRYELRVEAPGHLPFVDRVEVVRGATEEVLVLLAAPVRPFMEDGSVTGRLRWLAVPPVNVDATDLRLRQGLQTGLQTLVVTLDWPAAATAGKEIGFVLRRVCPETMEQTTFVVFEGCTADFEPFDYRTYGTAPPFVVRLEPTDLPFVPQDQASHEAGWAAAVTIAPQVRGGLGVVDTDIEIAVEAWYYEAAPPDHMV